MLSVANVRTLKIKPFDYFNDCEADMTINYIKVKKLTRTADDAPPEGCSDWLDFWKRKNPFYSPSSCSNRNCTSSQSDLLGTRVKVPGESDRQYVVPLCASCNELHNEFSVPEYKLMVVAKGEF